MTDMKQTKLPVSVFSESDIMECHFGHRWNKWEQIESNTTAVKYQGNICPVCSNEQPSMVIQYIRRCDNDRHKEHS